MTQNNEREALIARLYKQLKILSRHIDFNETQTIIDLIEAIKFIEQSPISQNDQTKQIPDGWKPIETVPKDGTQVIIKCSGGRVATAFYDDKPFVGEGWHVVVPFLGGGW